MNDSFQRPCHERRKRRRELHPESRVSRSERAVSAVLPDGRLAEMVIQPGRRTAFALWERGTWRFVRSVTLGDGLRIVPYDASDSLFVNGTMLLPTRPAEYGSDGDLLRAVRAFIRGHVDVDRGFEAYLAAYVLVTWLHDTFAEVPWIRVQGESGSGKTRLLRTVGSLCYKPVFAGAGSEISAIVRVTAAMRGTLVQDDWDGVGGGGMTGVYSGPKLVATPAVCRIGAVERDCFCGTLRRTALRPDIAISTPMSLDEEALGLRNKLLLYRFRNFERRAREA